MYLKRVDMSDMYSRPRVKDEFSEFANFFLKYLNGSSTFEEAYLRAASAYRKLFKKVPYQNCQSFLSDFYKTQYKN